ncbi:hypothetical protein PENSPDRAFT_683000 [Peniophora sp. CONT]|nr:hypothetical protein PENSPDRAFT_683000 [Peniophora sp. CONT]
MHSAEVAGLPGERDHIRYRELSYSRRGCVSGSTVSRVYKRTKSPTSGGRLILLLVAARILVDMADLAPKTTFGPILIGTFLSLVLFGVSTMQILHYAASFLRKDHAWMISMIAVLYALDAAHSAFTMMASFDLFVLHLGDINFFLSRSWVFQSIAWISAAIGLIVQLFYAWRVRVMLNSIAIAGVVCLCSLASFAGTIIMGVIAAKNPPRFWMHPLYETGLILWLAGSAVTDVLISTVLIWHLRSHKPGIKRTDDVIDKIVRLLWQTFAVTTLCAIIDVVLFLTLVNDGAYYMVFHYLLPKFYVISLLSSINSRRTYSQSISESHTSAPSLAFDHNRTSRCVDARTSPIQLSVIVRGSMGHMRAGSDGSDNTMVDECDSPIAKKTDCEFV